MIRGLFPHNLPNTPTFELTLAWKEVVTRRSFVLDTGFTGDLKITPETATELGLNPDTVEPIGIADGQKIRVPVAGAYVSMEGATGAVTVIVAPGAELAGIGLLTRFQYRAVIDCRYRTVELHKA